MTKPLALAESEAVLGAILFNPGWIDHAKLSASHFYDPTHAAMWDEIKQRQRDGRLIDMLSMRDFADRTFRELGGAKYLMRLSDVGAVTAAQVAGYGDAIRDAARRRAVMEAARIAINTAEKGEDDALTALEQQLQEIASNDTDADAWERMGEIACEAVERARLGETRGISTGIARLDEITNGLEPGTLWVVGGATGMGKSIVGAAISRAIASQGYGVAETHLEMRRTQIGLRAAAALAYRPQFAAASPSYSDAQRSALSNDQWSDMIGAAKATASLPIYVDARAGRTLSQIEAGARRLFRKMRREGIKPGALIIDHEGLIAAEPGSRFPSQLERTNARSEGLLGLAKRLNVGVIALSQLTKDGSRADGTDRMPALTDLNYGGALAQAADVVILIHRKAYYEARKPAELRDPAKLTNAAVLVVDKTRGGRTGQVDVEINPATAAVLEMRGAR